MSAIIRGISCPINLTPSCLTVDVGARGTENAGKLTLGLVVQDGGGVLCGDAGLALDECVIQSVQLGKKYIEIFSPPVSFSTGLRP